MTILLYANPAPIGSEGFYFLSWEEWQKAYPTIKDRDGKQVNEFDIEFIRGNVLDHELATAWKLSPKTIKSYFTAVTQWDDYAKLSFILAVKYHGKSFDAETVHSNLFDVSIYFESSHHALARHFVENEILGDIATVMKPYIDLDKFACDLAREYTKTEIAGETILYRLNEEAQS